MTQPKRSNEPSRLVRANWLGRYLDVEKDFDKDLRSVLLDSLSGIDEALERVTDDGFSKRIRRQQLALSNKAIRKTMHNVFGDVGNLIRDYRPNAAVAAVESELYDQKGILARVFKDPVHRAQYADSLKATASRNIESVMTRVLETEKPLSQRVYRTEALANAQVSKVINRALAKGDSAANIARDVRGLIDPNTPGGVSYAAKRLGRTEINNAFHAQSIHDAQNSPFVKQMKWNLSKVHEPDNCLCEIYSAQGIFLVDQVPEKPHPNCRCFVTPELEDYYVFENALVSGQYDDYLDQVLGFEDPSAPIKSASEVDPKMAAIRELEEAEAALKELRANGVRGQELVDAVGRKAEAQVEVDRINQEIETAQQERGFEIERQRQADAKAVRDAKTAAAQQAREAEQRAIEEAERQRQLLRNEIDPDETIPESIESATSAKQVANFLHSEYEGLSVEGFETKLIDPRFAREIGEGFVQQHDLHPKTNLRKIRVTDLPEGEVARTDLHKNGKTDMLFDRGLAENYESYLEQAIENQKPEKGFKTGFHGKRDMSKPWTGNFIHEWGHVLSFSGQSNLEKFLEPVILGGKRIQNVGDALKDEFIVQVLGMDPRDSLAEYPSDFQKLYERWVLDGLASGYSFEDKKRTKIDAVEAVAESYADSQMNPNASAVSKAIGRKLVDEILANKKLKVGVKKRAR